MALVGRSAETAIIAESIERVTSGTGAALLLSGPSGIGKTTLAESALELARRKGFVALRCRAQPLDQDLAYTLVIEAFGRHLRSVTPAERTEISDGLPALGQLFTDLPLPPPTPLSDPALERTRLFESVVRLLERISSRAPTLLLVDDLQWADPASIAVLSYAVRDLRHLPVLFITAVRDDSAPQVSDLLQSLRRTGCAAEMKIGPLAHEEISRLIGNILQGQPTDNLSETVAVHTGGVPMYVRVYSEWLRDSGRLTTEHNAWALAGQASSEVPPKVRDVLAMELAAMPTAHRVVAELVAVGGGKATSDVLHSLTQQSADIETALSEMIGTGWITEEITDSGIIYRFAHPLLHEAAYQAIPARQRRYWHAKFAEALGAAGDVQSQAAHVLAAGPAVAPDETFEVLLAAGNQALERYANSEALRFFRAASARAATAPPRRVGDLHWGLGEAQRRTGALAAAISTWRTALGSPDGPEDVHWRAKVYRMIADTESRRGDHSSAVQDVLRGLGELSSASTSMEHLELLYVLTMDRRRAADIAAAWNALSQLEAAAEKLQCPHGWMLRTDARVAMLLTSGAYAEAAREIAKAQQLLDIEHPFVYVSLRQFSGHIAAALGDLTTLRAVNKDLIDTHGGISASAWPYRTALYRYIELLYTGRWDLAAETLDTFADSHAIDSPRVLSAAKLFGAQLAAYRGDFTSADRLIMEGRAAVDSTEQAPAAADTLVQIFSGVVEVERGNYAGAASLLDCHLEPIELGIMPPWATIARGEAWARTGQCELAQQTIERLSELGPRGTFPALMGMRLKGLLLGSTGRPQQAQDVLVQAADGFAELGMPFEAARAALEAAEVPHAASELTGRLEAAHRAFTHCSAVRYAGRAVRQLRIRGVQVAKPVVAEKDLTPRQREIAELVALGMSNAEIAEQLYVSVRTVTSHLDHVYTRLGIKSRAALASYVTRLRSSSDATGALKSESEVHEHDGLRHNV